jgi:hypothetical protein
LGRIAADIFCVLQPNRNHEIMCAHAISDGLFVDGGQSLDGDGRGQQSRRAIAILERFLDRLGAARVRTTFFLIRIDGLEPATAQALCAEAAGPTRLHLPFEPGTFLVVDIGPRRSRNIEKAECQITAAMTERLKQLIGPVGDGAPIQVFMNAVHSWNFELTDLSFVIRQLRAAPPNAVRPAT